MTLEQETQEPEVPEFVGPYEIVEGEQSQVREWFMKLSNQVSIVDQTLDQDSPEVGKTKFTNTLAKQYEGEWKPPVDSMLKSMQEMDIEQLAACYSGIISALREKYRKPVDEWVDAQLEAQPKATTTLAPELKEKLHKDRSELMTQIKTIITMAETFGEKNEDNANDWPVPERRWATGKRGQRALTLFTWAIDGVQMDAENDSVKGVSEALGFDKVADFTEALRAEPHKINTTKPPADFSVTLKGKEVSAHRPTEEEEEAGEEEEAS